MDINWRDDIGSFIIDNSRGTGLITLIKVHASRIVTAMKGANEYDFDYIIDSEYGIREGVLYLKGKVLTATKIQPNTQYKEENITEFRNAFFIDEENIIPVKTNFTVKAGWYLQKSDTVKRYATSYFQIRS